MRPAHHRLLRPVLCRPPAHGQMALRDRLVFEFTRREKLPVFFVLAGGYQTPIRTKLLPLHLQTFQAAWEVYGRVAG